MWLLMVLTLKRQAGRSMLAGSGFLLAACSLILLSASTQTTVIRASQIINQNWRPTYDLVVLPPQAKVPANKIIPADLLEGYDGGISLQQYMQIKNLPGVTVAAPIAFIGYAKLPVPLIQFTPTLPTSGYYRIDWTLLAFNGQRQIIEDHKTTLADLEANCASVPPGDVQQALIQNGIEFQCGTAAFLSLDTGTFLLAAIDPTEENQLVNLDKGIVSGRMLTEKDSLQVDPRLPSIRLGGKPVPVYEVPMLLDQQMPGQITLHAIFTHVASDTLSPQTVLAKGGSRYLSHLPAQQVLYQGNVPLVQNDPQRFSFSTLVWDGHSWQSSDPANSPDVALNFSSSPSGLTYQPATPPAGNAGVAYEAIPHGIQGPEAAFRTLNPLSLVQEQGVKAFYSFDPIGSFSGNNIAAQFSNPLNWLPENTYTSPLVTLRYDAQGHPVPPTSLLPTTNPAGFVLQPPLAITTLAVARELKGEDCISAIRVRVSGINTANPDSWKRIQQVAQLIEQRTGLHVLVTLGSTPKPVLVYIPGVRQGQFGATQTIAPVGWIEERWIDIGADIVYLQQLDETHLLLLTTILLVCLAYQVITLSALFTFQRRELTILTALGWPPWQPIFLFLAQAFTLAATGGILGMGLALLIVVLIGASPPWIIIAWALPVVLSLALMGILYPLWQLWHMRPAEVLRTGTSITIHDTRLLTARLIWLFPTIMGLAMRNLSRSRLRTLIALLCLGCSAALLIVMLAGLLALREALQGTLLGDYVLLQTAVPQLTSALFALVLTFLSVADLLLLQVRERRLEIGLLLAIGWRSGLVQRLFVQEGIILALLGAIPGVLISLWVLAVQHQSQKTVPTPLFAGSVILVLMLVAALATLPALRSVKRVPVSEALRAA
ncbi:MAG TPA: FtsX-like permease family protein [Ktedonobacteraceae bacterium]|nr:FtsX-like permease family protein [Ktedonobacteraceae bacterium]